MDYTATKLSYESQGDEHGREIWAGELSGKLGFLTVTWNEACDTDVFHLDITLAEDEVGSQQVLTTVPCVDPMGVENCLWTVSVMTEAR